MRIPSSKRGIGPMQDSATFAAWSFDETATAAANDLVLNQRVLTPLGTAPTVVPGCIGNARTFTGAGILQRSANAADMTLGLGEWTVTQWVRILEESPGVMIPLPGSGATAYRHLFGLTGKEGAAGSGDNHIFSTEIMLVNNITNPNQQVWFRLRWENGAGVQVSAVANTVDVRALAGQWINLTWVKRSNGSGLFLYDCYVNGKVIYTTPSATANASDSTPTERRWTVGGFRNLAGSGVTNGFTGQTSWAQVQSGVMSADWIARCYRRGTQLDLPTSVYPKVTIKNSAGIDIDYSKNDTGYDFVSEASISDDVDNQTTTLTVSLERQIGDVSLSRDNGISIANNIGTVGSTTTPAIDIWREITCSFARVPMWTTPSPTDWQSRFYGRITNIDDGGDKLKIEARDIGVELADKWIENEIVYPLMTPGTASDPCNFDPTRPARSRQLVIAQILGDNIAIPPVLHTPVLPGSCMVSMQQPLSRGFVLPALQTIADGIGWIVRYKWDPLTEQYRLTFFDPIRDKAMCDVVLAPTDVVEVNQGAYSTDDIRNYVSVSFPNGGDPGLTNQELDSEGNYLPTTRTSNDATSIGNYGLRVIEIIEDGTQGINSPAEADKMADAILADLSTPLKEMSQSLPCTPEIDVGDVALFLPGKLRETQQFTGAVRSLTHTFSRRGSSTTIEAKGKPVSGRKRWLSLEAGRNGRPPIRNPAEALTGRGVGTLLPAVTAIVDRTLHLTTSKFITIKNGDFARFSRGTNYPPDGWTSPSWGADIRAISSVATPTPAGDEIGRTGGQTIEMDTGSLGIISNEIPIEHHDTCRYSVSFNFAPKSDIFSGVNSNIGLLLTWLRYDKSVIPSVSPKLVPTVDIANGEWFTHRINNLTPPAEARFLMVGMYPGNDVAGLYLSSIEVFKMAPGAELRTRNVRISTGALAADAQYAVPFFSVAAPIYSPIVYNVGDCIQKVGPAGGEFHYFKINTAGRYTISCNCEIYKTAGAAAWSGVLQVVKNALYTAGTRAPVALDSSILASSPMFGTALNQAMNANISTQLSLSAGDRISFEFRPFIAGTYAFNPTAARASSSPTFAVIRQELAQ